MAKTFFVKSTDILRLRKLVKQYPQKMRAVTAKILNDLAFHTRKEALKILENKLLIKQKNFISKIILVKKTTASKPMNDQKSTVGSIRRPRFSGFEEQELGTKTKRTRVASLYGRGGIKRAVIKGTYRLRRTFPTPSNFKGIDSSHRTTVMLASLSRQKYKKPFIITKHKKFRPGLYRFLRKKIVPLQHFKPRRLQPQRLRWLSMAYEKTYQNIGIGGLWLRALKKIFRN